MKFKITNSAVFFKNKIKSNGTFNLDEIAQSWIKLKIGEIIFYWYFYFRFWVGLLIIELETYRKFEFRKKIDKFNFLKLIPFWLFKIKDYSIIALKNIYEKST